MTDEELCGADTGDGGECQNPAVEDGACWIPSHSDPDAENPHGRDFSITEDDHDALLEAARLGKSKRGCARSAGVGKDALERYLDSKPDFRDSFTRARGQGEAELIEGGLRDPDTDPSMARFLLSASFGYKKAEKRETEISGEGGGPVEIQFTEEVVETDWSDDE